MITGHNRLHGMTLPRIRFTGLDLNPRKACRRTWKPAMSKGEVGNCCAGSFIQYFAIFLQSSPKSCDSQKETSRFLNILQSSNILTRASGGGEDLSFWNHLSFVDQSNALDGRNRASFFPGKPD